MLTLFAESGPKNTRVLATFISACAGIYSKKLRPGRYDDNDLSSYLTSANVAGWGARSTPLEGCCN